MPSQAFNGKSGTFKKATTEIEIKNWKVKAETVLTSYVSNLTAGWEKQLPGSSKWSGSVQAYAVAGAPPCAQGDSFVGHFAEDATHTPGSGSLVVESVEESVDVEDTNKPVMFDITFKGDGPWTPPSA